MIPDLSFKNTYWGLTFQFMASGAIGSHHTVIDDPPEP